MKFRSSIFSFDTLDVAPARVLGAGAAVAILLLIAAEIAVRFWIPAGARPAGSYYNEELRDQVAQLEKTSRIDLYFVGSSVAAVNLVPVAFDDELRKRGIEFNSFNAGIRGSDLEGAAEGFFTLFWRQRRAANVAVIVSPVDLNEAESFVRDRTQAMIRSFRKPKLVAKMEEWLSVSWLFGFRSELREFARKGKWTHTPSMVSTRGHVDMGEAPHRRYNFIFRFDPDGPTARALRALVARLTRRGVRVLVVEGLLDSGTWKTIDPESRETFWRILEAAAAPENARFVRLRASARPRDDEFIDQLHLGTESARRFSRAMARELASYLTVTK